MGGDHGPRELQPGVVAHSLDQERPAEPRRHRLDRPTDQILVAATANGTVQIASDMRDDPVDHLDMPQCLRTGLAVDEAQDAGLVLASRWRSKPLANRGDVQTKE